MPNDGEFPFALSLVTAPHQPLVPATARPYPTVLEPVQVPEGCYPIEVVQFWRGEYTLYKPIPLHWAIVIRTSAQRGNKHEIVGTTKTYAMRNEFDVFLHETADWRGSHVVGYVAPEWMDFFLNHIALVPIVRDQWTWNSQNWVYDVLEGLRYSGLYTDMNMTLGSLQTQMVCILEAWELGEI